MIKLFKSVMLLLVVVGLFGLAGCAAPANYEKMIVRPTSSTKLNPKLKGAVLVSSIIGGKKTNPMWTSQVDNESFGKALTASLDAYGYLANSSDQAKYRLSAHLLELKQPFMGIDMDVRSVIKYTLVGPGASKDYRIDAIGIGKFSDAFMAIERLKVANEKSIYENIGKFLQEISS